MKPLWVEIESLVLDGIPLDPVRGRRLSALTQAALERLLRIRGIAGSNPRRVPPPAAPATIAAPPAADESWWAEAIARELHQILDRMG
jgi:hypothetical protein